MNKQGFLILAQNSQGINYVKQAYVAALSIKRTQKVKNVSLVTNDEVPDKWRKAFDEIIPIPFGDHAESSEWKVENRWKLYHASPYYRTIVLDSDVLILDSLEQCWKFTEDRDLFFTSKVTNYKGQTVVDKTYRKMFIDNDLPNLYTGMFYFKKGPYAETFFKLLEVIVYNWKRFFKDLAPRNTQDFVSIDVASAIAVKILGIDDQVIHKDSPFTFVHMKPALQGWASVPATCSSRINVTMNGKKQLFVGPYMQHGVFHYVENELLTGEILGRLNA
jgi:hypothetical protein